MLHDPKLPVFANPAETLFNPVHASMDWAACRVGREGREETGREKG